MAKTTTRKPVKSVYVTPGGLQETKAELTYLKTQRRTMVTERIERAREFGDIEENSEYEAALEEQTLLENRIAYLEQTLSLVKVISKASTSSGIVVIGSTVKVEMDGTIDEFTIVGKLEANPARKKISNESPVGAVLLGAKVGEEVEVVTPIIRYKVKILEVR